MKIKVNDTVLVISGKDRGRQAKVMSVLPKENKVVLDGLNIAQRHQKASGMNQQSGIIPKAIPLRASKVMVVCPKCGVPTRCGYKILEDGTKTRYCSGKRGCGETF